MTTVIASEKLQTFSNEGNADGQPLGLPLGAPKQEKRFWFQRNKSNYDPDATATQVITPHMPNDPRPYMKVLFAYYANVPNSQVCSMILQ